MIPLQEGEEGVKHPRGYWKKGLKPIDTTAELLEVIKGVFIFNLYMGTKGSDCLGDLVTQELIWLSKLNFIREDMQIKGFQR